MKCRCGYEGGDADDGRHPCHGRAYTCRKPAQRRFYNARPATLAGVHMKLSVDDTFACDECWAAFCGGE